MNDSIDAANSPRPIGIRRILFAVGDTDAAFDALPFAAMFATLFGAEFIVAHIVSHADYNTFEALQREHELLRLAAATRERIGALSAGTELNFRVVVERGDVVELLPALAAREKIDLIVTHSEGRHGLEKLLSPPVDEEIARIAPCPVLLVGPQAAISAPPARLRRILHPVDFNPQSRHSLEYAYALARRCGAELYLLHVADDVWKEPLSTRIEPEAFCRMRMAEAGLPESGGSVEPRFLVEFGAPEALILENAAKFDVDLILMGMPVSAHPGFTAHLPGPLAYNVASHATCPVLALNHPAEKEPRRTGRP